MLNSIIESLVDILTVAAVLAPVEDQLIKLRSRVFIVNE